jgi:hypothetical protein
MTLVPLAERPSLLEAGLEFSRFGYFVRPLSAQDVASRGAAAQAWLNLENQIRALQKGDFSAVQPLLASTRASTDWRFKTVAIRVLGHVGSADCFRQMRAELEALPIREMKTVDVATRETVLLYCEAFVAWGRLDVVPVLLDWYLSLRLKKTPEIAILPVLMARLLVDDSSDSMIGLEPPEDRLEDYLNLVMQQYDAVVERLGSDKLIVYRGAAFSVRDIAERMRRSAGQSDAVTLRRLRERFEPSTGIDCSAIFTGPSLSPMQAAALAEAFLDSCEVDRYEPGNRYFFRQAVPG